MSFLSRDSGDTHPEGSLANLNRDSLSYLLAKLETIWSKALADIFLNTEDLINALCDKYPEMPLNT